MAIRPRRLGCESRSRTEPVRPVESPAVAVCVSSIGLCAVRRFHLHQSVRRRVCRAVFCLACLLPTTALLGWTATCKLPGHIERCEGRLSELLGLNVSIQRIRYPQPGICLYEGLGLTDPETHRTVLRCRWVEFGHTGKTLVLRPAAVEVNSEAAGRLVRLMMRRLQHELPAGDATVRILPTSVTLRGPHDEQTYDDAECLIESSDADDSATLRFRLAGVEMSEAATVIVTRRHSEEASTTRVSLNTAGASLPVSMFATWLDAEKVLGRDARFRGSLWIDEDGHGRRGDVTGVLSEVDLETLVTARFPHVLTGRTTLEIDRARFEQGRLIEAAGQLHGEQGVVGSSLIAAAVKSLGCRTRRATDRAADRTPADKLPYRRLFLRFALDQQGLRLAGLPTGPNAGAVFLDANRRPLLIEPARQALPLLALIRALVPPSQTHVPATLETSTLVPWLPLPPIVPPLADDGSPPLPSARVRLGTNK